MLKPLTMWITTNCGKSSRDGNTRPPYLLLRNLYAGQEATVKTGRGTMDWLDLLAVQGTLKSLLQHHSSKASKVMLKILQVRLQQYANSELPYVQPGFRKGRGTRDQIANIHWIIEKAREFQKPSISALLTVPMPLIVWITTNCGKFFKRWEYQTTLPAT